MHKDGDGVMRRLELRGVVVVGGGGGGGGQTGIDVAQHGGRTERDGGHGRMGAGRRDRRFESVGGVLVGGVLVAMMSTVG